MSKPQGLFKHEDVALVLIDYQPEMFANIRSETSSDLIDLNVRLLIKAAKAFDIPVILSTVGVKYGVNHPTRQSIVDELPGVTAIDRTSMNAWEDDAFRAAVEATGRKKLIFGALYTEICLAFPVLEAMADGYDATFVVDAVGGMSQLAHRTAVERLTNAGAAPNTAIAIVTELFRDWESPVADKARTILKDYAGNLVAWAGR
ncbi:isochorismatase family protein [Caulobacter sp. BE254]|uniref:isochorismatase family protein n=1 Tax=Caulobacter sp. BE254 TaxID=2817720 RepID=UPI00285E9BB2|nr:isochorismatase family protein [Caulobacter sp. BE254]MDR7116484.1 nicotinamidase-related amidase [Caulobacter sp. BE254]